MDGRKPRYEPDGGTSERGRRLAAYARGQAERATGVRPSPSRSSIPADALPGYDILGEVHRGAQGAVYEGFHHVTKRRVAIKFMHESGRTGLRNQGRFEREIEVLAQLRHPNIVAVHDGGMTPSGRWFLVMDYIEGVPVDEYVAANELSVEETLRSFVTICQAVNAAHLRGVVHRDLKPSNIRVDDAGQPHVLDFGLAKILDPRAAGPPGVTMTGEFLGSLQWASPEQVDGSQDQIDVRSDVYALGVLLFHMLTGEFPYSVDGPMRDVLVRIVGRAPSRPSTLRSELDDDVDTIILKCLSKDADRRYQSAGELARDIEHYLNHQPIAAKRDSTLYVVRRLVRRHRMFSTAVVGGLAALVVFGVTVTILLGRAQRAETDSRNALRTAINTASVVVTTLVPKLLRLPGTLDARNELLQVASTEFGQLIEQGATDPSLRAQRADMLVALSDMKVATDSRDEAMRLRREVVAIREQLVRESPDDPTLASKLAKDYVRVGDLLEGPSQLANRRQLYERAFEIDSELVERFPDRVDFLDDLAFDHERLGDMSKNAGDYATAEELFGKQYELATSLVERAPERPGSHWAVLCSLGQLGAMREHRGDLVEHARLQLEAMSVARRLLELDPDKPEYMKAVGSTAASIAAHQGAAVLPGSAIATMKEVEPIMRRLVELDPSNHDRQRDIASYYLSLAGAYNIMQDFAEAEHFASEAFEVLRGLPESAHDNPDQLRLILSAADGLAILAHARSDIEARSRFGGEAADAANRLEEKLGTDAAILLSLADLWGRCQTPELCDPVRAESLARRSIELSHGAIPRTHYALAQALHTQGKQDQAREAANRALALCPADASPLRADIERLINSLPDPER